MCTDVFLTMQSVPFSSTVNWFFGLKSKSQKIFKEKWGKIFMPMTYGHISSGPTCTCTPPDKNDWKLTQFYQGIKTIKCEKCGESWNESDLEGDPVWKAGGMY